MQSPFTQKILALIAAIPEGMVSTYGIIAYYGGNHRGARQVARILHSSSRKYGLPWHRVINRSGKISLPPGSGYALQKKLLESEGVVFNDNGKIDLEKYLWLPE